MRALQFLKFLCALIVLALCFNHAADLWNIQYEGLILNLCAGVLVILFVVSLYRNWLIGDLTRKQLAREYLLHVHLNKKAALESSFHEALPAVVLLIPGIAALFIFPEQPWIGASVFLVGGESIVQAFRQQKPDRSHLIVAKDHLFLKQKYPRRITFHTLRSVDLKYEHLFFTHAREEVDTLNLEHLSDISKREVMETLIGRLDEQRIMVSEEVRTYASGQPGEGKSSE